jgi:NADH-quinone oxidoreductase subunit L
MNSLLTQLWLVPVLPLLAAGVLALTPRHCRRLAAGLAIGALAVSLVLALAAWTGTLGHSGPEGFRAVHNFTWLTWGNHALRLGWVLDPLSAVMLVMVSFVGLVIFVYSAGYMAGDENFTRFFCFLSLFAGAMLAVVMANSLVLLFAAWELVGLASYLLIGFWFQKPEAAAAAKKAFLTTRVGDLGLFVALLWLYDATGTLVFYDEGRGCLEAAAVAALAGQTLAAGLTLSAVLGLLVLLGAAGKSGQVPLHVWLPDAMEGPTPVSALIHAATMVAAGVFLVARLYPLFAAQPAGSQGVPLALQAVAWLGAVTAVFAALIAVAQTDLKRILAYSTVSQLGYMFLGLGVGGVAVGLFHLLTHACFKALLFLGAGSVIHGCHGEQDIRRLGGLRRMMPVTFLTYAVGTMALAGVPLLFSGFWSKEEILHAAHAWPVSKGPFYLGLLGALLTAFYMTRQVVFVFFGPYRGTTAPGGHAVAPHESPPIMTVPLGILAASSVVLGFFGTPAWPGLLAYLDPAHAGPAGPDLGRLLSAEVLKLMGLSTAVVAAGLALGWGLYGRRPIADPAAPDALELALPGLFRLLREKFRVDEFYEATVVRWHARWAALGDLLDRGVWGGLVLLTQGLTVGLAWLSRALDEFGVNGGFDAACRRLRHDGARIAGMSTGRLPAYLRGAVAGAAALGLLLLWGGCR